MGSLFIQTEIEPGRVGAAGQPPWETIELDVLVDYNPLVVSAYLETARFSDFRRAGGETVRYYHLVNYGRGLCLSLPASGYGRIISGIYYTREVCLARPPVDLSSLFAGEADPCKPINVAAFSHLYLLLQPEGRIIARFNCLESFDSNWTLSASLRIPEALLHGYSQAPAFMDALERHQALIEPCFEPQTIRTVDATLIVEIGKSLDREFSVHLQVGSQVVRLPLSSEPMIL